MKQYIDICKKVIEFGEIKSNRTGIDTIGYHGDMMKFDLQKGFPAVTTKKLAFKSVVAEMLGFLRGYQNASHFRELGCKVWDANANENEAWLCNDYRKGEDDLGRIYGVQARNWLMPIWNEDAKVEEVQYIDQLKKVVHDLSRGVDNRREIVTHWNPGELGRMALPPCHLLYQFGIQGNYLNMCMYQRSCDLPLGIPFNIAGYAWLLSVIARITRLEPGVFTHFMHDIHIYENQFGLMEEQIKRKYYSLPELYINPMISTLEDLETWVTPDDFELRNYIHHDSIKYPFAL